MRNPVYFYALFNLRGIIRNLKSIKVQNKDVINAFLVLVVLKTVRET